MKKNTSFTRRNFLQGMAAGAGLLTLNAWETSAGLDFYPLAKLSSLSATPDVGEEEFWNMVRTQMMLRKDIMYLNNGSFGSTPRMVFDAVVKGFRMIAEDPKSTGKLLEKIEEVRKKVADFVGASEDEIALTRSTTEGMSMVAAGLPLKKGDEVLISDHEHSAGTQPWLLRGARDGIELREVKIPCPPESPEQILNLFNDALTKKTRVISISHMTHAHGLLLPVKELCKLARDKGIFTVLDAAHPPGMFPFDLHDIDPDFYAGSPHKWLDAPAGSGIFYVRKDRIDTLWPMYGARGWDRKNARRFEATGTKVWPVTCALGKAIDFQLAIGRERIEKRGRELSSYFKQRVREIPGVELLTPLDPKMCCSIGSFSLGEYKSIDVYNYLLEKHNIITGPKNKRNALRVSTHFYNTKKEVDACLEGIEEIAKNGLEDLSPSLGWPDFLDY